MAIKRMQAKKWQQLIEAGDPLTQDFAQGPSPGGAAAELGCTRQEIHRLIRAGHLDALYVYQGVGLSHYTISPASLRRYKAARKARLLAKLKAIT